MNQLIERAVAELFKEAGADPTRPDGTVELATAILGGDCFRYLPTGSLAGGAALCRVRGRWYIYIAKGMTGARLNHAVGHELGHLYCARINYHPANEEQIADRIGGALCAPKPAFLLAVREHGAALRTLARCFVLSMRGVTLRLGETTSMPTALASGEQVRFRGEAWDWPPNEHLQAGAVVAGAKLRKVERAAFAYCVA
jgi:hypothetical protein